MTATEFNAARTLLALTDEAIAADFNVTPAVVRAWAAGRVQVPKRIAQVLALRAALAERHAAILASGLAECTWLDTRPDVYASGDSGAISREASMVTAHVASCATCIARDRFVHEHFGPLPSLPVPGWVRLLRRIERVPAWARPAVVGAGVLALLVAVRVLFVVPQLLSDPGRLGDVIIAVAAAAAAGAFGGFAYSLTRPALRKLGGAGAYLTGIVCVAAYMGALALASPYAFGRTFVSSRSDFFIFGFVVLLFGLFIGHSWFRDEEL